MANEFWSKTSPEPVDSASIVARMELAYRGIPVEFDDDMPARGRAYFIRSEVADALLAHRVVRYWRGRKYVTKPLARFVRRANG